MRSLFLATSYIYLIFYLMSELSIGVSAYLTLETISEISNLTRGARGCVVGGCEEGGLLLGGSELGDKNGVVRSGKGCLGEGQVVLMGGEGRSREEVGESEIGGMRDGRGRDEVEDDVTASLKILNQAILKHLNKPSPSTSPSTPPSTCPSITKNFHTFLRETTLLLRAIEDTLIRWRWEGGSELFDSLGYLQALWASRGTNRQKRSFIEQQMALYGATGCFSNENGGSSNEVLRRDVEIVEYMNDLLDAFH